MDEPAAAATEHASSVAVLVWENKWAALQAEALPRRFAISRVSAGAWTEGGRRPR